MSYSSDLTKERILECAKQEFLSKGFAGANMREIATNSKVTTGALYNHFKNKEILFDALVGKVADDLCELYKSEHQKSNHVASYAAESTQDLFTNAIEVIIDYLYAHFDAIYLLFSHSIGTKHESYKDRLIEIEEATALAMLSREGMTLNDSDKFFVHVIASSGVNNMLEAIYHNLTKSEAMAYMEKVQTFHYAGWLKILGRES